MPRPCPGLIHRCPALLAAAALGSLGACGGRTGLIVRHDGGQPAPSEIAPSEDGSCPPPTSRCGSGSNARCIALDSDAANCGACGLACTPGIACLAGVCQQTKCAGAVAFHEIARFAPSVQGTKDFPYSTYLGADLNRDGRLDLIEVNHAGDLASRLGQGDGNFAVTTNYATEGSSITPALPGYAAVGDFNEDGLMDLAVASRNGDSVELRPGLPGGGLGGPTGTPLSRFDMGDLDLDGHLDALAEHWDPDGGLDRFTVMRGRGDGSFARGASYALADDLVGGGNLQDWDGDGALDLITIGNTVHVRPGNGDGTFAADQRCGLGTLYQSGYLLDLNRDGMLDALWVIGRYRIATVLGEGGCRFTPILGYPLSVEPAGGLATGDLDGDGIPDLVVAGWASETALFLGNDDGSFTAAPDLPIHLDDGIFIADVNDDGRADIVTVGSGGIVVFSNTCDR